jgi:hypothetical protein
MLSNAKRRARESGVLFNLTEADVVIPTHCPALGIPLSLTDGAAGPNSPSLDRLFPNLGYTRDNVTVISNLANTIKTTASSDQILAVGHWLKSLGA